jgi:hypothetical protein
MKSRSKPSHNTTMNKLCDCSKPATVLFHNKHVCKDCKEKDKSKRFSLRGDLTADKPPITKASFEI